MMIRFYWTIALSLLPFLPIAQQITTVTPSTAIQGQTLQVSISGQNTFFTQTSTTSWLTRGVDAILPSVTSVLGPTQMNVIYSFPSNAALGYWDLHVTHGSGELLKLDAIFIDAFIGVDARGPGIQESISIGPNPAVDHFLLRYALPGKARVQVSLRDLKGNLVKGLYSGDQGPGEHDVRVEVSDLPLASGVFLACLQVDEMVFAVRVMVVR
jgi:hypothetical protein